MYVFKTAVFCLFALLSACALATEVVGKFNIVTEYNIKNPHGPGTVLKRNTALFQRKLKSAKTLTLVEHNLHSWTNGEFNISPSASAHYNVEATRKYANRGDSADAIQRAKSAINRHAQDE